MSSGVNYPGTPQHQAVLRAIVDHYCDDERILTVLVFGSLGRGDWHRLSDIDLDIVIADDARLGPIEEIGRLTEALANAGERAELIIPDDVDAVDVVFASLLELSVRYHPLETTSPNIVDSLRVLSGRLDTATISTAGRARQHPSRIPHEQLLNQCLRYAVEVQHNLERQRLWSAIEGLHRARGLLMEVFAQSRGGGRSLRTFQSQAGPSLQSSLAATLPRLDDGSITAALALLLDFLEHELAGLSGGNVVLTQRQRQVLVQVRDRLNAHS